MSEWTLVANLGLALLLGALIGLERQWRARGAGLRTTALVAAGAALFVMLSKYGFADLADIPRQTYDGSRVAAQIVSGIGFLGAGVIMRGGQRVQGLNTAATMWCSAAVGALCGAHMQALAVVGAVGVLFVHVILRPVARLVDRASSSGDELCAVPPVYEIGVRCAQGTADDVRTALVRDLRQEGFELRALTGRRSDREEEAVVSAVVAGGSRSDDRVERVVSRVSRDASVREAYWRTGGTGAAPWG